MRLALSLAALLILPQCTTIKSIFAPSEVAVLDQCAASELQPAIGAVLSQAGQDAVLQNQSVADAALDSLAAATPEGEAAVGCALQALSTAVESTAESDAGSVLPVSTFALLERSRQSFEQRHRRIAVLPNPDGGR